MLLDVHFCFPRQFGESEAGGPTADDLPIDVDDDDENPDEPPPRLCSIVSSHHGCATHNVVF